LTRLEPHGMDFSDTGEFPAVVEVVLGNGYRFKSGTTDEEAAAIIKRVSDWVLEDEQRRHEHETGTGRFAN
jgi:hypothetical protein